MKKWLVFLCIFFIVISIAISILSSKGKDEEEIKQQEEDKYIIEYKANQTIRVRMSKTNEVVAMDINDYLRGVVASEMPPAYNIEALKAQAVVARTYTYRKMLEQVEVDADICDDFNHCQVYYDKDTLRRIWTGKGFDEQTIQENFRKVNEAVVSTENEVIVFEGEYIKAFFHASSPVKTENVDQIWGGISMPYLLSVDNVEYENYPNRTSENNIMFSDLENKIKETINKGYKLNNKNNIKINSYTTSGRVKDVYFDGTVISAEKLRVMFGLKSTNFTIDITENEVVFHVIGYGHGVGMSQVGANYLADNGSSYIDIIKHYYTGVEVITIESTKEGEK